MKVLLQSVPNKNRTVTTSFGAISFDDKGFASQDVSESDLELCRNLNWLVETSVNREAQLEHLYTQHAAMLESVKQMEAQIETLEEEVKKEKEKKPQQSSKASAADTKNDEALMKKLEAQGQAAAAKEAAASVSAAGNRK